MGRLLVPPGRHLDQGHPGFRQGLLEGDRILNDETVEVLCGMAVLLAVVVDHYDRRDNEAAYRRFSEWAAVWAWGLFLLALLMHLVTWLIVLLTG